jgi:DNA-binding response OmpR family regulator
MAETHVLFVEDDDVIREATQLALERDGFAVTAMPDGLLGLEAFRRNRPDIALLDVMVPGLDGVSLCRRIRDESTVPVIMLSARADSIDVVLGLEAGADDYVTKPFSPRELVARLQAALRRAAPDSAAPVLTADGLELDLAAHAVHVDGAEVHLTPIEYDLLKTLMQNRGRLLTHSALLTAVWGQSYAEDLATLRSHIANLRRKVERPDDTRHIRTESGIGYRFTG